ncbi:MAG TPA: hypothetical protein VF789_32945 [Thermoanaerobaculia bacterium]
MDQESIAFFEERFREISREISSLREDTTRQISGLREETAHQFASLRAETTQQISGLREETAQQSASLREEATQHISSLREEMERRFDKQDETARHTLILVEGLRDNLQLVGEVVMGLGEQVNRYHHESTLSFEKVHGWIEPYFRNLDLKQDGLERRVGILEDRADRQQGDAMDAIRRMVEKLRREPQPASE